MEINIISEPDAVRLAISGQADVSSAMQLHSHLLSAIQQSSNIIIDARQADLLDVAIAQMLLATKLEPGINLQLLMDPEGPAWAWLKDSGLLQRLDVCPLAMAG